MKLTYVWVVTTVIKTGQGDHDRPVAVCDSFECAEDMVLNNACDIYENGWYPYAVIERTALNCVYPFSKKIFWYEWVDNSLHTGYLLLKEPPLGHENISGYGIG